MDRILVPTDFSDCSMNALKVAAKLAKAMNAEITLVHVYEKPLSGIALQVEVDLHALKDVKQIITDRMEEIAGEPFLEGIAVSKFFVSDKRIWEILDTNSFSSVDLVVMGSHGTGGMKKGFMGSNAQRFVQTASCPVLVIKDEVDLKSLKNVVFVSDFFKETEQGFKPIKKFADMLDAKIHLLKIITPINFESTKYTKRLMQDFANKFELTNYSIDIYNEVSVERGVFNFCDDMKEVLLAIETHGRKGIAHFVFGSLAEDIVNHTSTPILTSRIENDAVEV